MCVHLSFFFLFLLFALILLVCDNNLQTRHQPRLLNTTGKEASTRWTTHERCQPWPQQESTLAWLWAAWVWCSSSSSFGAGSASCWPCATIPLRTPRQTHRITLATAGALQSTAACCLLPYPLLKTCRSATTRRLSLAAAAAAATAAVPAE